MNSYDYYIIDYILVDYVEDGEGVNQLRILLQRRHRLVRHRLRHVDLAGLQGDLVLAPLEGFGDFVEHAHGCLPVAGLG